MGPGGSRRVPKNLELGLKEFNRKGREREGEGGRVTPRKGEQADRNDAILIMYQFRPLPKSAFIIAGINSP